MEWVLLDWLTMSTLLSCSAALSFFLITVFVVEFFVYIARLQSIFSEIDIALFSSAIVFLIFYYGLL